MRLADKVCVITGAGSGMGRVAAGMFAAQGARVVVADYNEAAAARDRRGRHRRRRPGHAVHADVSQEADAKAMIDHAVGHLRPRGRALQQRRHHARGGPLGHRHGRRHLGPGDGRQRAGRVPGLQARHPAHGRAGQRLGHQHRELRGAARLLRAPGRLHRVQGRAAVADPQPGGPVRSVTACAPTPSAPAPWRRRCSWTGCSRTRRPSSCVSRATPAAASASPRRS